MAEELFNLKNEINELITEFYLLMLDLNPPELKDKTDLQIGKMRSLVLESRDFSFLETFKKQLQFNIEQVSILKNAKQQFNVDFEIFFVDNLEEDVITEKELVNYKEVLNKNLDVNDFIQEIGNLERK